MLNTNGEGLHSCLVPDFSRKSFSFFSLLSIVFAMGLSLSGFCYIVICYLFAHFDMSFYHEWILNFVECFFCIY